MITSQQELTRDLIFYSVCVSDFEKLDFKNDALAGVRANYFNSNIGNGFTPQPIVAPKKVCTTFQNQYVEQPIICPIECRRVNNIVYVPRYYPRYEQTCYTQTNRY